MNIDYGDRLLKITGFPEGLSEEEITKKVTMLGKVEFIDHKGGTHFVLYEEEPDDDAVRLK